MLSDSCVADAICSLIEAIELDPDRSERLKITLKGDLASCCRQMPNLSPALRAAPGSEEGPGARRARRNLVAAEGSTHHVPLRIPRQPPARKSLGRRSLPAHSQNRNR